MLNPPVKGKIQGLFKAFECFSSTFQGKYNFQGLFKTVLYIFNTFQACVNPVSGPSVGLTVLATRKLPKLEQSAKANSVHPDQTVPKWTGQDLRYSSFNQYPGH